MLRDPFADPDLVAYLEACNRYSDAVETMTTLVALGDHMTFARAAARARQLAAEVETARLLLQKKKAATSVLFSGQNNGSCSQTTL